METAVPNPPAQGQKKALTGTQKAAVLMVILGESVSSDVLRQLEDDEVQRIGRELAALRMISSELAEEVLSEFYQMLTAQEYVLKGGLDYAQKILVSAFGPDHAKRLLERVTSTLSVDSASFDALQRADPQQLANFIHNEHPQTIALILSHLGPVQAAGLVESLPPQLRADVAIRMANLDQISPEIIAKIANIVGDKLRSLGEVNREAYGGARAVAEMFNRLDQKERKGILEKIETSNPELYDTIRHLMFVFEDLLKVEASGMRELLARVDRKILTIALKGTSEPLKEHFLQTMSQRGADMLREDMDALGPVKMREVESAQQQIIAVVRQLEIEGIVDLTPDGGSEYVS